MAGMSVEGDAVEQEAQTEVAPASDERKWRKVLVGGMIGAVALTVAGGVYSLSGASTPRFERAADACEVPWLLILGDDGRTMTISGGGEKETMYSIEDIACILDELEVPDSMLSRMDSTRALDGQQVGEWDGITARWTYHPEPGLSLILTED